MIDTPFQRSELHADLRPIRIAYFIPSDNGDEFARVVRLSCTQWGGIQHVIIPVRSDTSIASINEHLLKIHRPDWLVEFGVGRSEVMQLVNQLFPQRDMKILTGRDFELTDPTVTPLGVFAPNAMEGQVLSEPTIELSGSQDIARLAIFGELHPQHKQDFLNEKLTFREVVFDGPSPEFWHSQLKRGTFDSPVNLTGIGIHPVVVSDGFDSPIFDVVVGSGPGSACYYWNVRATREATTFFDVGRRTILCPLEFFTNSLPALANVIRENWSYPNLTSNLHVRFLKWTDEESAAVANALQNAKDFQRSTAGRVTVEHRWSRSGPLIENLTDRPLIYAMAMPTLPGSFGVGAGKRFRASLEVQPGPNEIELFTTAPLPNRFGQSLAIEMQSAIWQRYPATPVISRSIKEDSFFNPSNLTIVGVFRGEEHLVHVKLPTEWETTRASFADMGWEVRRSRNGQYAEGVVQLIGGAPELDVIASGAAYSLLTVLAVRSSKKLIQELRRQVGEATDMELFQRALAAVDVIADERGAARTFRQLYSDQALQPFRDALLSLLTRFVERKIVRRGFFLECPNCGASEWHMLEQLSEILKCSGCGHSFVLPIELPRASENTWHYRLNTLMNRAMDQDVVPHLLALRKVSQVAPCFCRVPGIELQSGTVTREFDFVALRNRRWIAGECKAGSRLTDKDFSSARLAEQLHFSHFFFCTMEPSFDAESAKRIDQLRADLSGKLNIDVLNARDLLS